MTGLSTLLNDAEYFAAFRTVQAYNRYEDQRPTKAARDEAMAAMVRIETERGIRGSAHHTLKPEAAAAPAAPETGFRKVDGEWAYVRGARVHTLNADKDSFEVLKERDYAKDKNRVFYKSEEFPGADPATFEILERDRFAKDKKHVYVMTYPIPGAEAASFRILEGPYSRDAVRIYCGTVTVETSNVEAFEPLECTSMWHISSNKNSFLFDYGESFSKLEISRDHPAVTGSGWGRDGKYYYYGPGRVAGADYASFKIVSDYEAVDKDRKYFWTFPEDELPARRERFLK